jgi:hypothetical protein
MSKKLTSEDFDSLPEEPDSEQIATISLKNWREQLKANNALEQRITQLIDNAVKEAARLGRRVKVEDIGRAFQNNPTLRKALVTEMKHLAKEMTATIETGSKEAWMRANSGASEIIAQLAAGNAALAAILQAEQNKPQNDRALIAFQQREVAGMNLSGRVWNIVNNTQRDLERAIEVSLAEGTPAQKLSQRIRQLLQEPNRLYRRVRDADGNLKLSQAAQQYNPGRGVYRSSYKNAMRLARTEVNMAYHTADNERWTKSWWVRGIRIWLSNNHTIKDSKGHRVPLVDICDDLKGDYPADFKFTGWHPQCRCLATAITVDYATIRDYYRRKRAGEDMSGYTPPGMITKTPEAFNRWLETNADRLSAAATKGTTPYFIRDNAKYTNPNYVPPEQRDELEAALGIKRGAPMSFEEANEMRGNPHYSEAESYRVNCQTCVVANELRRRGFPVEALANTKGSTSELLSRATNMAWVNDEGVAPNKIHIGGRVTMKGTSIIYPKVNWKQFSEATKDPGRYHVNWKWKGKRDGHVVTFERFEDGTARWYDPQNGAVNFMTKAYAARFNTMEVLRVDNLMPNPDICSKVLAKSGSKIIGGEAATARGMLGKPSEDLIALRKQALQSDAFRLSTEFRHGNTLRTKQLYLYKKPLERIINHCSNAEEINAVKYAMNNIDVLRYRRTRPLGDNKDMSASKDRKNLYRKRKRGVEEYIEYEFEYNGTTWLLGMERHVANFEQPYYIYKK